ncbi:hypothetical protein Tmar_1153 [Thermaerobacter marianensis DSM 12885]|uniref:Glycosyl transferase family 4 n=1 Tax=Thermaerobacter marianensis (strain ATCC 700841 / DSM 12885 / JCM 10246 / 7p75a) TaxID=644966 RepID=E6SKQ8_THEM7|nr:hypothetical protein [Thermaerobacter marianensis]ADU51266.1 hypothetical protein Tmar_1153 [Thermaerobacter marianensis DSM 12885]
MTPAEGGALLAALVLGAAATAMLAAATGQRLQRARLVRPNYRGRPVVTGLGVALLAGPLAAAALGAVLAGTVAGGGPAAGGTALASLPVPGPVTPAEPVLAGRSNAFAGGRTPAPLALLFAAAPSLLALVAATALVGLVDDLLDEPVRGWRGHLAPGAAWTGGRLKLAALPLVAWVLVPAPAPGAGPRLIAAALLAGAAGGMNLLDRRPGRALKAFFATWLCLAALAPAAALALLPLAVAALVLLPLDLEERAMLGDAGSNALGAALGWAVAAFVPPAAHLPVLAGLIALHLLGEFASLSRIIDALPPLRWLDRLGTRPHAPAVPQGSSWAKE